MSAKKLKVFILTLAHTMAWNSKAITKLADIFGSSTLAYLNVHMEAICSLVTDPHNNGPVSSSAVTLALDRFL